MPAKRSISYISSLAIAPCVGKRNRAGAQEEQHYAHLNVLFNVGLRSVYCLL